MKKQVKQKKSGQAVMCLNMMSQNNFFKEKPGVSRCESFFLQEKAE